MGQRIILFLVFVAFTNPTISIGQGVTPFEEDCIQLTISDSLVKLLENPDSGVWSYAIANVRSEEKKPFWNGECLEVPIFGGGFGRELIEYNLIWDGKFYNDTVHVHFYFTDPKYKEGAQRNAIGWTLTKYFSIQEIIGSSPYRTTYVKTHFRDFRERYPPNTTIEIRKRIKKKN